MLLSLVYTSETGVESEEPLVIEQVISTQVRMNDATYGLKTAAKKVHDTVARAEWQRQKNQAIAKQHTREASKKQVKIDALDADIAKIAHSLVTGTSSDPVKAKTLVDTLTAKRQSLL